MAGLLQAGKDTKTMTDIWCFTCGHELGHDGRGGYVHEDPDDEDGCPCVIDEMRCEPR